MYRMRCTHCTFSSENFNFIFLENKKGWTKLFFRLKNTDIATINIPQSDLCFQCRVPALAETLHMTS